MTKQRIKDMLKHLEKTGVRATAFFLVLFAVLSDNICVSADQNISFAKLDYNGNVVGNIAGVTMLYRDDISLRENGKSIDAIDWRVKGRCDKNSAIHRRGVNGLFSVTVSTETIPDGFQITWDYEFSSDPAGKTVELSAHVPADVLKDIPRHPGKTIAFGPDKKAAVASGGCAYQFDLSGSDADFTFIRLEDFRHADWFKDFRLRLETKPLTRKNVKLVLRVTGEIAKNAASPFLLIPVAKYGNRGLSDDIQNDGKGGWTDQGSNDLSTLQPGVLKTQGVPFEIGDRAIILKSLQRPGFPEKSPEIPVDAKVERLCFCQALAWGGGAQIPVFHYRVTYADDTTIDVPMIQSIDVFDWWNTSGGTRARVAWRGNSGEHAAALFHSQWKNPKPDVAVKTVQVVSDNQNAVPIVLGITAVRNDGKFSNLIEMLTREFASTPDQAAMLPREKKDWFECPLDFLGKIEEGSALDASFVNPAPAGKYGFLKKVGDHFEFEKRPGKKAVFWGTNLGGYSAYVSKDLAPSIAKSLARHGVNAVRIHLWATNQKNPKFPELIANNFVLPDGSIRPAALDDMQFFHSELIKNGIYVYMDVYDTGSYLVNMLGKTGDPKFQPEFNDAVKKMAKTLFTAVNPYTGKSMVDDPAYVMFEIMNENSCTYSGGTPLEKFPPEIYQILSDNWEQWQTAHRISPHTPLTGLPQNGMGPEGRRFFATLQKEYIDGMKKFLRSIGVKVPICGTNLELTAGDLWASQNMDFMNDHTYFGSTSGTGGFWKPQDVSILGSPLTYLPILGEIVHSRLADKPIVCTEWSDVYPNIYRCEAYPVIAAYSAFQEFDGMFSFDWGGAYIAGYMPWLIKEPRIICLTQILDPSTFGLNQAAAIAVLRGDVKPAGKTVTLKYTTDDVWNNRRQIATGVSFLYQMCRVDIELLPSGKKTEWPLGTGKNNKELYAEAVKRLGVKSGNDFITSDTGELTRFADPGLFLLNTPKSQFAIGALYSMSKDPRRTLSAFNVISPMQFATLTFSSLDDRPLAESRRILCCAVANSANADSYIEGENYVETLKGPVMAEPITATITAKAVSGLPLKVFKLDTMTGKRTGELPVAERDGKETFAIDEKAKTMYFELVR